MLDSDLAKLYHVETKRVNEAVKRNINKFPDRFSWILSLDEVKILRSQIATSTEENVRGGRRYTPRVFTEQGVAMLATILNSEIAVSMSIKIIDAFVLMKKYINSDNLNYRLSNIETKIIDYDIKFDKLFNKLSINKKYNEIYFNGQIYDAYSKIMSIMESANDSLIIVDNYADRNLLDMISKLKVNVLLITRKNNLLSNLDTEKYNKEYHNLAIKYDNTFHDRYIIVDKKTFYHLGASINYAGSKTFSINLFEDAFVKESLLNIIGGINEWTKDNRWY